MRKIIKDFRKNDELTPYGWTVQWRIPSSRHSALQEVRKSFEADDETDRS